MTSDSHCRSRLRVSVQAHIERDRHGGVIAKVHSDVANTQAAENTVDVTL